MTKKQQQPTCSINNCPKTKVIKELKTNLKAGYMAE
jgi:hypothetical protein